jgi:hypothetical protein
MTFKDRRTVQFSPNYRFDSRKGAVLLIYSWCLRVPKIWRAGWLSYGPKLKSKEAKRSYLRRESPSLLVLNLI